MTVQTDFDLEKLRAIGKIVRLSLDAMSTVIGHEALRLSVAGQTAQGYFALLAQDMQLETSRRTLKSREDSFRIYTARYKQGDITELDWQRARAEVETARAQVHTNTVAVDKAEAGLAVLLGRSPRDIMAASCCRMRGAASPANALCVLWGRYASRAVAAAVRLRRMPGRQCT